MPQSAIRCQNLTRRYGELTVLNALNLNVEEGEFVALLGESGCGKTTALRLIAGFDRPTNGTITIAGRTVTSPDTFVAPENRRVGMVFQQYALFPHLSVADNIGYGLRGDANRTVRINEVLALVGLTGLGERTPGELSGGQQQRVALARALAPRPEVILLDEPFSNLDAGLRVRLRLELRQILATTNVTTIFVTHDQEEALSLADRVAVLNGGQIAQVAPPEALYRLPATREIAEFVGEANFVPGYAEGDRVLCAIGGDLALPLCRPVRGQVDVLLRPEWIVPTPATNGEAVVVRRMYFGHDQLMIVRLVNTGDTLQVRLGPDDVYQPGDRVTLSVDLPVVAYPRTGNNGNVPGAVPTSVSLSASVED